MGEVGLNPWLQALGFEHNPFSHREAGADPFLNEYFVTPPYFDDVLGDPAVPQTALVWAPRGGGKTALLRMVDYHCQGTLKNGAILSVPYTDFARLIEQVQGDLGRVTARLHTNEILGCAVAALAEQAPQWVAHVSDLVEEDRALLEWYLVTFGMQLGPRQWAALRTANLRLSPWWEDPGVGYVRDEQMRSHASTRKSLQERLELSPALLLRDYAGLVQKIGYRCTYILLDRIDEAPATAADSAAMVALIEPLIADLTLMNQPGLAFKCFLPDLLEPDLLALPTIRPDRIVIRHVAWGQDALLDILRRRLEAFSAYSSLDQLCVPELRGRIEHEMVQLAEGSPRNLVRLGELLFSEQGRRPRSADEGDWFITEAVWQTARQHFAQSPERNGAAAAQPPAPVALPPAAAAVGSEVPDEVLDTVRSSFPAPIAMVCRDFIIQNSAVLKFHRALDLFEIILRFVLFALIGEARVLVPALKAGDKTLKDIVGMEMHEVHLGRVLRVIETLTGLLAGRHGKLGRAVQRFHSRQRGRLQEIVAVRNRFAHGMLEGEPAYEGTWRSLREELALLIADLLVLGQIRLIWVESIVREGTSFHHQARLCMGDHPNFPQVDITWPEALECRQVWGLLDDAAIPLHPLLLWAPCPECKQLEVFVYNLWDGEQAEYLSPALGHRFKTAEYAEALGSLLGVRGWRWTHE